MARYYKRKYRIKFTQVVNTPQIGEASEVHNINDDGTVKPFSIRVVFRLPIIYGDLSGSADLELYNLNPAHREALRVDEFFGNKQRAVDDGANVVDVEIEAGYEDDSLFSKIWSGTIIFGRSVYEAPNWVTRLQLTPSVDVQRAVTVITQPKGGGSFNSPNASIMNQCVNEITGLGVDADSGINDKIQSFGVLVDDLNTSSAGASKSKGTFKNGNPLNILNTLLRQVDCRAWIDPASNTLKMDQTSIVGGQFLTVNEKSGLIGVPEESRNTVKFVNLLNPSFKPGIGVSIESKTITQKVHVNSAEINCDSDPRGPWNISMEGARINE